MQKDSGELTALTSLRGVAAVLVVLHHYCLVFTDDIGRWMPSRILLNAYLCVDLFFMLSGFVLAYVYHAFNGGIKSSDYRNYLLARFARIYPSHLFTLGVVLVLEFAALAIWANSEIVHSRWAPPFTAESLRAGAAWRGRSRTAPVAVLTVAPCLTRSSAGL